MRIDLFLLPFAMAFALTAALCLLLLLLPFFRQRFWRHGERHEGKNMLPRLGGLAMCLAFLYVVFWDPHLVITREIAGLLVGSVFVCLFGLWDDFQELSFKAQALLQVGLTVILFVFGLRITSLRNPFGDAWILSEQGALSIILGFVFLFLWTALVINAVNWLDGLDGLLGSVSLVTFLVIFFLSLKPEVNQPPIAILAIIAAGISTSFLFFNVYPAKIMAGTSGSMLLGLLISALAIIAGTKIATALLVLALPVADALWVVIERLRSGQSVFLPDKRHLHYKLRELGWSEGRIAWFFFLFTAFIGLIALFTESLGKLIAWLLVLSIIFSFLIFVEHKTRQKHPLKHNSQGI
jgi:UDP-GlcNAc:undecaprenyl-phosphate/decaprenyl-phosphate GlcNAc-1-phosphate transferase